MSRPDTAIIAGTTVVVLGEREVAAYVGAPGQKGADGAPGDQPFIYDMPAPDTVVIITHNLGRWPTVTFEDTAGTPWLVVADHLSINQLKVTFVALMQGRFMLG